MKRRTRCVPGTSLSGRITGRPGSRKQEASRGRPLEEEDIVRPGPSGGRPLWARACPRGISFHRIGKHARRPPQAGLGGSPLEGHRPSKGHEGGAGAPHGGVFRSTFPSRRSKARRSRPTGVRQQGHSGATGVQSHERRPSLPAVAPHPGEDGELRVCVDAPGLNQVTSLERLWPSRVGRCGGPPHIYVRMPYGLPSVADAY